MGGVVIGGAHIERHARVSSPLNLLEESTAKRELEGRVGVFSATAAPPFESCAIAV